MALPGEIGSLEVAEFGPEDSQTEEFAPGAPLAANLIPYRPSISCNFSNNFR